MRNAASSHAHPRAHNTGGTAGSDTNAAGNTTAADVDDDGGDLAAVDDVEDPALCARDG